MCFFPSNFASFCPSTYLPTPHLIAEWFSEAWRAQTFFSSAIKTNYYCLLPYCSKRCLANKHLLSTSYIELPLRSHSFTHLFKQNDLSANSYADTITVKCGVGDTKGPQAQFRLVRQCHLQWPLMTPACCRSCPFDLLPHGSRVGLRN